jgi:hypothetical protein
MSEIILEDDKYTVLHEDGANLRALHYGEPWRDLVGDGLVLALVQRIEYLNRGIKTQNHTYAELVRSHHYALEDVADTAYDNGYYDGLRDGRLEDTNENT